MTSFSVYAQKSYALISSSNGYIYVFGDVPLEKNTYSCSTSYSSYRKVKMEVVNSLAEKGYEVEFMDDGEILMSKRSSGGYNAVRSVVLNENEDVTEVARYNLQGLPVKEHDKGVQIIVYSNYTTKTVIVQ